MYRYGLVNRPAGLGTVPKGLDYRVESRPAEGVAHHEIARHGVLVCSRRLTDEELQSFELAELVEGDALQALAQAVCEAGLARYARAYLEMFGSEPEEQVRDLRQRVRDLEPKRVRSVSDWEELARCVTQQLKAAAERDQQCADA